MVKCSLKKYNINYTTFKGTVSVGVNMHKILSYLLICVGLLILFFAVQGAYRVFVGGGNVATVVHFTDFSLQLPTGTFKLPMEAANTLTNMGLFALFIGILIMAGGKIALVGCSLLKNERIYDALVRLNKENVPPVEKLKNL